MRPLLHKAPTGTTAGKIALRIVVGSPESSISLLYLGPAKRQKGPMSPSSADRLRDLRPKR